MGYRVFDVKNQEYRAADADTLPQLISSGQFQLGAGEKIRVLGPQGETFEAGPETNFAELAKNGFTIEAFADKNKRERLERAGEMPLAAAGLGAIRGATGGLSDLGSRVLPEVAQEAFSDLREANPTASVVGEIAGTIGSAAFAPGASVPGAFGKVGSAVTKAVAEDLGIQLGERVITGLGFKTTGSQLMNRAAANFAGQAAEGAMYGAAQALTETALGDPNQAAQNFISNVGLGAAIGGIGGAGIGVFSDLIRGRPASFVQKKVSEGLEGIDKLNQLSRGIDDEDLRRLIKEPLKKGEYSDLRGRVLDYMAKPEQAKTTFANGIQDLFTLTNDLSYGITGDLRGSMIKDFGKAQGQVARKGFYHAIDTVKGNLDNVNAMLNGPDKNLYDTNSLQKLKSLMENTRKDLSSVYKNKDRTLSDVYEVLQKHRQEYDAFTKQYYKKTMSQQAFYTKPIVDEMRLTLKDALANEDVYGLIGKNNKEINKAISEFMTAKENFLPNFGKVEDAVGGEKWVIDPGKMGNFLNNQESTSNALRKKYFDSYFDSIEKVVKLSEEKGMTGALPAEVRTALGNMGAMRGQLNDVRASMLALNRIQSYTGKSLTGLLLGSTVGGALGGVIDESGAGASLGSALGWAYSNPVTLFRVLARAEQGILKNKTAFGESINRFLGGMPIKKQPGPSAVRAGGMNSLAQIINAATQTDDTSKTDLGVNKKIKFDKTNIDSSVPKIMTDILSVDPMRVAEMTQNNLEGLGSAAPNMAMAASATAARGIQFLQAKVPKETITQYEMLPQKRQFQPSSAEIGKFKRYVDGVMNPQDAINKIEKGTFTREHAEALREVYPDLYQQVQEHIQETLMTVKKNISYDKKLQLSTLMNIPTMAVLTPTFLKQVQSVYSMPSTQPNKKKPLSTQLAENNVTATQQAMSAS